ncbi:hypothetical protein SAMN05216267_102037 [Actinacidiphila rubida]|uniref:Uncharacterized protein n=1 Tax=Actinacidiphila rubida TaxID=310780 RepID=A0A1H8MW71_9ACTN|nr:hypothetical protein [Actinacidiphila rubida]SEO21607.1 hypothetical protein SAMN05216267_102037 [Actinacidiphila rubida]
MSELQGLHTATINAIVDHAGRATLPLQRAHRDERHATAFWFNELVETTAEEEVVRQYLVTAGEPSRIDLAEFTLRPQLCAPTMSATKLLMPDFADQWIHLDGLGVAVMPTSGLHAHGARKGWHWTTDEITDGIAAREEDLAGIGATPVAAYALGHLAEEADDAREQAVVMGEVARTGSGGDIRWIGDLPRGCVGAPVFFSRGLGGDRFTMLCLGVALPGEGSHTIATFDRIRTALSALAAPAPEPAPEPHTPAPPLPASKRPRWWRRS